MFVNYHEINSVLLKIIKEVISEQRINERNLLSLVRIFGKEKILNVGFGNRNTRKWFEENESTLIKLIDLKK
jgi:hypothetical protein